MKQHKYSRKLRDSDRICNVPAKLVYRIMPILVISYFSSQILPIEIKVSSLLIFNIFIGFVLMIVFTERSAQARTLITISKSMFPDLPERMEIYIESAKISDLNKLSKQITKFESVLQLESYLKQLQLNKNGVP